MSVLCHGHCHVTLVGSPACMCGKVASTSAPYPLSGGIFHGYVPPKQPAPPVADGACDVSLVQLRAAQLIEDATHLSADGGRVFIQRLGNVRVCFWDEEAKVFGSSFPLSELPADAVAM